MLKRRSCTLRLLCITAHPDDEAGAFGGSLLLYRRRGVETHVICVTSGEAATNKGDARSPQELALLRRHEFRTACDILGVQRGTVLDYPDGDLASVPLAVIVPELVRHIRQIRPDVIVCFGLEGSSTTHLDHAMSGLFATMAYHWAGRSDTCAERLCREIPPHRTGKLYYVTWDSVLPERQPVSLPPASAVIDVSTFIEEKIRAYRAHTTQAALFERFEKTLRQHAPVEMFHLAATAQITVMQNETDLFAGIAESGSAPDMVAM